MSVFDKSCGRFRLKVSDPWPMWVEIQADGEDVISRLRSTELHDLRYLIDRAIIAAEHRDPTP